MPEAAKVRRGIVTQSHHRIYRTAICTKHNISLTISVARIVTVQPPVRRRLLEGLSRDDGGNGKAIEMSFVSLSEIAEDVSVLSSAGGRDAEHSFEEAASSLGLCAEGELSSNGGVSDLLFGFVVGGLYPWVADKDPKGALVHEQSTGAAAEPWQVGFGGLEESLIDPGHEASHFLLELGPGKTAISQGMPPSEHQLGVAHEAPSEATNFPCFLGKADKTAIEMRPAKLATQLVDPVVGSVLVAGHDALKPLAEQSLGALRGSGFKDFEDHDKRRYRDPQPLAHAFFPVRRFVDPDQVMFHYERFGFGHRLGQGLAHAGFASTDGAHRHHEGEQIEEQLPGAAFAEPVLAGEQHYQRRHRGTEKVRMHARRKGRLAPMTTGTQPAEHAMLHNLHSSIHEVCYLVRPELAGLIGHETLASAGLALPRNMDHNLMDPFRWQKFSVMPLVTFLRSLLFTLPLCPVASCRRLLRGAPRRVRTRRLRRIRRVHSSFSFGFVPRPGQCRHVNGDSSNRRVPPGEFRVPLSDFRVPLGEFRVSLGEFRVSLGEFRVSLGEFRVPLGEFRVPLGEFRVSLGEFRLENRDARAQFFDDRQKGCWVNDLHTQYTPQIKAFVDPRSARDLAGLYESISTGDTRSRDPGIGGGVNGYLPRGTGGTILVNWKR